MRAAQETAEAQSKAVSSAGMNHTQRTVAFAVPSVNDTDGESGELYQLSNALRQVSVSSCASPADWGDFRSTIKESISSSALRHAADVPNGMIEEDEEFALSVNGVVPEGVER